MKTAPIHRGGQAAEKRPVWHKDQPDMGVLLAYLESSSGGEGIKTPSAACPQIRDMSLSIGQSAGYINNIENGANYPSITVFFYICDYFGITPKEFFDMEMSSPIKAHALVSAAQGLNDEQLNNLIAIAKGLSR